MGTVRRSVTMPALLAAAIDAADADGAADSVSGLLATAARRHLNQLTDDRVTTPPASARTPNLHSSDVPGPALRRAGWERLT